MPLNLNHDGPEGAVTLTECPVVDSAVLSSDAENLAQLD